MFKQLVNNIEEYIIGVSLLVMAIINFANVLSRYLLHASWAFTEEITTNLFVLASLLGAAVAAKRGSHLGLSILTDFLPPRFQKYVTLFSVVCAVILFSVLFKYGINMVQSQIKYGQTSPALGWPEWIFGLAIPVGAFSLIIRFMQLGITEFIKKEGK
ncbi:MAG: TRAP transporter small permease [Peptococcaceae bacterium]